LLALRQHDISGRHRVLSKVLPKLDKRLA